MKKFYLLLLSIVITGIACKKSGADEIVNTSIVSTWKMTEYIVHRSDGTTQWLDADPAQPEEITFYASGDFSSNQNFLVHDQGYNKYRIIDSSFIELSSTSTSNKATFYYKFENANQLIFNPVCRESCSRRYVR